jgi:hypothetical protein
VIYVINRTKSQVSNQKTISAITSVVNSSDNPPENGIKNNDTTRASMEGGLSIDYDLFYSLSDIRKTEYALFITLDMCHYYINNTHKLALPIARELALAQLQALELVYAALYQKCVKLNNCSKNQYVR